MHKYRIDIAELSDHGRAAARAAERAGSRTVIYREKVPLAAVVSVAELQRIEPSTPTDDEENALASLCGVFDDDIFVDSMSDLSNTGLFLRDPPPTRRWAERVDEEPTAVTRAVKMPAKTEPMPEVEPSAGPSAAKAPAKTEPMPEVEPATTRGGRPPPPPKRRKRPPRTTLPMGARLNERARVSDPKHQAADDEAAVSVRPVGLIGPSSPASPGGKIPTRTGTTLPPPGRKPSSDEDGGK